MRHPHKAPSRIAATGLQRTNLSAVLHGLERKGLIERHASPGDRRGMIVRATQRGKTNYALVRQKWASAVSVAASHDTSNLDAALSLLRATEAGLTAARPPHPRPASKADVRTARWPS
jgi:DNA-binding MarR family transcriptional regulator